MSLRTACTKTPALEFDVEDFNDLLAQVEKYEQVTDIDSAKKPTEP